MIDAIYDAAIAAHRSLGAEPNRDWIATVITNAVFDALAEFIGDGFLDAHGQLWTPLRVTAVGTHPEEPLYVRCEDDETVRREWRTHPLFILERHDERTGL